MLHDEYVMNVNTGELIPATEAIKDFYKTHSAMESWTSEWRPTGQETKTYIDAPDFCGAVNV